MADFTIDTPITGTEFVVGDTYEITWSCVGSVALVKLDYSIDSGSTWPDTGAYIISASTDNDSSFIWTIPDAISRFARVRIRSIFDDDAYDIMTEDFRIKGVLSVNNPALGNQWEIGKTYGMGLAPYEPGITWLTTGTIPISLANCLTISTYLGSVPGWGMTSPILASQIPLAKCNARNFSGLPVYLANKLGSKEEVLVVNIVFSGAAFAR